MTLSNAVRNSSSRWSWNAMPTSVIGLVTDRPPTTMSPRLRLQQPRHHQHQRALAAAGRPDDRDELAGLDVDADLLQRQERLVGVLAEGLRTRLMRIGTPDFVHRAPSVAAPVMRSPTAASHARDRRQRHLRHEQRLASPLHDALVLVHDLDVEGRDRLRRLRLAVAQLGDRDSSRRSCRRRRSARRTSTR